MASVHADPIRVFIKDSGSWEEKAFGREGEAARLLPGMRSL
jgi:hypothetical protein